MWWSKTYQAMNNLGGCVYEVHWLSRSISWVEIPWCVVEHETGDVESSDHREWEFLTSCLLQQCSVASYKRCKTEQYTLGYFKCKNAASDNHNYTNYIWWTSVRYAPIPLICSQIRAEIDGIWRLQKRGNILKLLKPFYILFVEVFGFAKLLTDNQLHPSSFRTTTKREVDFLNPEFGEIRKSTVNRGIPRCVQTQGKSEELHLDGSLWIIRVTHSYFTHIKIHENISKNETYHVIISRDSNGMNSQ